MTIGWAVAMILQWPCRIGMLTCEDHDRFSRRFRLMLETVQESIARFAATKSAVAIFKPDIVWKPPSRH
jgi:hypothetical protein